MYVRPIRRISRRRLIRLTAVGAASIVIAVLVPPAFGIRNGFSDVFPWAKRSASAPAIDPGNAERLATTSAWGGYDVSLWLLPKSDGASCVAIRFSVRSTGRPPAGAPSAFANGGLNCNIGGSTQPAGQLQLFLDWYPADGAPWGSASSDGAVLLMSGHVPDGLDITRVELRSPIGAAALPLGKGYFLAWLRGPTAMGQLPAGARADAVVALDSSGRDVARVDLRDFMDNVTPRS